jgi:hemerythrin-like domain-containing protein
MLLDEARCVQGDKVALAAMKQEIKELAEFYPRHIEREDEHFFLPCMEYLSPADQAGMLKAFSEFDAKLIHEKYKLVIEELRGGQGS